MSELKIEPLDPVGGEVQGLDDREILADVAKTLHEAWLRYGILLFRNIDTVEKHLAVSRCFGELEMHPCPEFRAKEDPYLFAIGGEGATAFVFDEAEIRMNAIPWHRDTAFVPHVCKGAMLRMVQVPERHGETLLADTAAAYDDLPRDVREKLDRLEYLSVLKLGVGDYHGPGTWWSSAREARDDEYPDGTKPLSSIQVPRKEDYPAVVMPAVLDHPDSGRKCIFVSPMNIEHFMGMPRAESDELVNFVVRHMTKPRFVYKHAWNVNDAIMWDNRRFLHAAAGNRPGEGCRYGLRTTLAGKLLNVGRYHEALAEPAE